MLTLTKDRLIWYLSEKDIQEKKPKNFISLSGCDVINTSQITGKPTFLVCTALGQEYEIELTDSTKQVASDWTKHIKGQIEESNKPKHSSEESLDLTLKKCEGLIEEGWLSYEAKKRYFILVRRAPIKRSLNADLGIFFKNSQTDSALFGYQEKPGEELRGIAAINRVRDNISEVKSLFRENRPLFTITLAGCNVYLLTASIIYLDTPRRQHEFSAKNEQEAQSWIEAIRFSIVKSNLESEKSMEIDAKNGKVKFGTGWSSRKSGWLQKRGQARWFLVVNDILMWFTNEQTSQLSRHAKVNCSSF